MKNRLKKYTKSLIFSIFVIGLMISCEDYLDKAPESTITENDVFGNFVSFQGFIEEIHYCAVDYHAGAGTVPQWTLADESLTSSPYAFDQGNYWNNAGMFSGQSASTDPQLTQGIWNVGWYGIRKANLALAKLDLLVEATQEEKNIIKGEALFWRGWLHFEIARYWGGMPYIDKALSSSDDLRLPRLSFRETALKCAEDFRAAADLLPVDWDQTQAGQLTLGGNRQRVAKGWALGYLGKVLLYAASPMMNEASGGPAAFDAELCKQAATAFSELINLSASTGMYELFDFEHWTDNFWVWSPGNLILPGGKEYIMPTPIFNNGRVRWQSVGRHAPVQLGQGNNNVEVPAHNYVKNYGMANGLPISDPASGYQATDPWTGREPRFYVDIIIDGDQLANSTAAGVDRFAQLYNGGRHRGGQQGSATGYFLRRFNPLGCNSWDDRWSNFQSSFAFLRLADVYLMYAEAVLHGYGAASNSVTGGITAEEAVNRVRNRALLPDLTAPYTATKEAFMGVIIRERAVELGWESTHRWCDLRRWNLNGTTEYINKTELRFDRDPVTGKPINLQEELVITRVVEKRHNWLPLDVADTKRYAEFPQNPGW